MDSRYVPFVHKGILSVLYIVCIVEKKAKIADFSTFFAKIVYMLAYVYFFIVPSDAALALLFKYYDLCRIIILWAVVPTLYGTTL
jgi:hypothetical protein